MSERAMSSACVTPDLAAAKATSQPRSVVWPHALHHSSVVLIPAGWNAEMKVERGTSVPDAEPSHPGNARG